MYLSFRDQLLHGKSEGADPSDVPPVALQKDMKQQTFWNVILLRKKRMKVVITLNPMMSKNDRLWKIFSRFQSQAYLIKLRN